MKKLVLLCLIVLSSYGVSVAQWEFDSVPGYGWINSIFYLNADTGFVVYDNGVVIRTNDDGANWIYQQVGSDENEDIYFFNSDTGIVAGRERIWKTTDGGSLWSIVYFYANPINSAPMFTDISFPSTDTGYVAGYEGKLMKTTNNGDTWTDLQSTLSENIYAVFFINNEVGFIGSEDYLLKTSNGGLDWTVVDSSATINDIHFLNDTLGFVLAQNSNVWKTTDGGATWSKQRVACNSALGELSFPSESVGYIVAHNAVLKTTNVGETWHYAKFNSDWDGLWAIYFTDINKGHVGGWYWTYISTTNGGGVPDLNVLQGTILTNDSIPLVNSKVRFYTNYNSDTLFMLVDSTYTDPNGWYMISTEHDKIFMEVIPDSFLFPDEAVTYYGPKFNLNQAQYIALCDFDTTTVNFQTLVLGLEENNSRRNVKAYPNPFDNTVSLFLDAPYDREVEVGVYSITGQEVQVHVKSVWDKTRYEVIIDGSNLDVGVYLYKVTSETKTYLGKLIKLH